MRVRPQPRSTAEGSPVARTSSSSASLAAAVLVLVVGLSVGLSSVGGGRSSDPMTRAEDLLAEYPVIDGFVNQFVNVS